MVLLVCWASSGLRDTFQRGQTVQSVQSDYPYRSVRLGDLTPIVETRADGSLLVRSAAPLGRYPRCITDALVRWAREAPDRTLFAWRRGDDFVHLSYRDALALVRGVAQALIDRGLSEERPLAVLSGNSLEHLLLALAAQHAGVLYVPISPAYSLVSSDFSTLKHVLSRVSPGLVFASDARFGRAIDAAVDRDVEIVAQGETARIGSRGATPFESLRGTTPAGDVDRAHARVGPDTIAKILFTSGSTGTPKGVINTHRMLCANQEMIRATLPFLGDEPPVLVDWLPWHHTFGGNHNIGIALYNGGSLYLDEGRPLPGAFDESIRNLRDVAPTVYFNVPRGYEELVRALDRDPALAACFFSRLHLLFYAAASLSQTVADDLQRIAIRTCGERILLVTGLGATETAPMAIGRPWKDDSAAAIGLPVPGVEVKLAPVREKLEVRVRGPNVTPGYWKEPALTRGAFDEDGFYRMGDAARLIDPDNASKGLRFDGRIGEDFKLSSGTWVSVGPLRARAIVHLSPYVRDVVIAGHDRGEPALLAVPDLDACRAVSPDLADAPAADVLAHAAVRSALRTRLQAFAAQATGSATRIVRLTLLEEPLSLDAQEVTDKGSVNQHAVLARRAALVEELYAQPAPPHVVAVDHNPARSTE